MKLATTGLQSWPQTPLQGLASSPVSPDGFAGEVALGFATVPPSTGTIPPDPGAAFATQAAAAAVLPTSPPVPLLPPVTTSAGPLSSKASALPNTLAAQTVTVAFAQPTTITTTPPANIAMHTPPVVDLADGSPAEAAATHQTSPDSTMPNASNGRATLAVDLPIVAAMLDAPSVNSTRIGLAADLPATPADPVAQAAAPTPDDAKAKPQTPPAAAVPTATADPIGGTMPLTTPALSPPLALLPAPVAELPAASAVPVVHAAVSNLPAADDAKAKPQTRSAVTVPAVTDDPIGNTMPLPTPTLSPPLAPPAATAEALVTAPPARTSSDRPPPRTPVAAKPSILATGIDSVALMPSLLPLPTAMTAQVSMLAEPRNASPTSAATVTGSARDDATLASTSTSAHVAEPAATPFAVALPGPDAAANATAATSGFAAADAPHAVLIPQLASPITVAVSAHIPVIAAQSGHIGRDLGVEIARRVSVGGDELVVRLDPAELGRIEVRMSFDDRGGLRTVIAADSAVALDMLRRDSADLSRSLTDAGFRSDGQSLHFDSGGDRGGGQPRSPWSSATVKPDEPDGFSTTDAFEQTPYRSLRTSGRYDVIA